MQLASLFNILVHLCVVRKKYVYLARPQSENLLTSNNYEPGDAPAFLLREEELGRLDVSSSFILGIELL